MIVKLILIFGTFCSLAECYSTASLMIRSNKIYSLNSKISNVNDNVKDRTYFNVMKSLSALSILVFNSKQNKVIADSESVNSSLQTVTRNDVGFINLNETLPRVTDVAWMDIKIGESDPQRIEISLFGDVCPITCENFKILCQNKNGYGYKNSNIFRVISQFSIQGGNIGNDESILPSKMSKYGKSGTGEPFPQENFKILHSYDKAGVVSMMKDIQNKGYQDSRFFITVKEYASWADDKYTAFGLVTKGMNYITGMTIVPVEAPANYPKTTIKIIDSGVY